MPKPMKQHPIINIAKKTVKSAELPGIKINIYGQGKTGKTRLLSTFPKPMLIVGTEDGTMSIANGREAIASIGSNDLVIHELKFRGQPLGIQFAQIDSTEDFQACLDYAILSCKSIALDHASGFQNIVFKEVLGLSEIPMQRTWGMAKQQQWGVINSQTNYWLARMLDLSRTKSMNVVVIAHERDLTKEKDSENGESIIIPRIGSALTPGSADWLNGAVDYICQTFIRAETTVEERQQKDGTIIRLAGKTGKCEYCLRIGPHPVYSTGFRVAPDIVLPDVIVNPTYDKIREIIQGE